MSTEGSNFGSDAARCARLTVLCDNTAIAPGTVSAHGLSVLVETPDRRVLFDTGPDERTVANAYALGIPLTGLDAVVLSHGHYDHLGGLAAVLHEAGPLSVLAHRVHFEESFVQDEAGRLRSIGSMLSTALYEQLGARFEWGETHRWLGEHLLVTGEMDLPESPDAGTWPFKRRGPDGIEPDDFRHEQALVVLTDDISVVLAGCAHPGAAQVVRHAHHARPGQAPHALVGGLHISAATDQSIRQMALRLHATGVRHLLPCHCTGDRAVGMLRTCFLGEVVPIGVGSVISVFVDGTLDVSNSAAVSGGLT